MEQELLQEIDCVEVEINKTEDSIENRLIVEHIKGKVLWILGMSELAFNINVQVAKSMLVDLFEEKYWSLYQ